MLMKKFYLVLAVLLAAFSIIFPGCTKQEDVLAHDEDQFYSLDAPETIAYLHNAVLSSYFNRTTKSSTELIETPSYYVPVFGEILTEEAEKIGLSISIKQNEIDEIINMCTIMETIQNNSEIDAFSYLLGFSPLPTDVQTKLVELAAIDMKNGTEHALEYMKLYSEETKSTIPIANYFSSVGYASKDFWQTKYATKADVREAFSYLADAAASFLGILGSTAASYTASHAKVMSLDDAMDTNCD